MPIDQKTPEQLLCEIAYYAAVLPRTTSADRIQRFRRAIQKREHLLVEARRVRVGILLRKDREAL